MSESANRLTLSPSLLAEWSKAQLDQAAKAVYTDDPSMSFTLAASPSTRTVEDMLALEFHDYDKPTVAHIDPKLVRVGGIAHIAGVDISYDPELDSAIIALVILSYPSLEVKHTFMREILPTQPYVPSFLSMRELEHVLDIYDKATTSVPQADKPDVVFVDGFGRWHERQAGLATALGVERGIVTVGIGKEYQPLRPDLDQFVMPESTTSPMPPWPEDGHFRSKQKSFRTTCRSLLRGRGDFLGIPLHRGGPLVGAAMYTAPGKTKTQNQTPSSSPAPLYISPGNNISLVSALLLTLTCCVRKGVRQPEPIILADRAGRDELHRRKSAVGK